MNINKKKYAIINDNVPCLVKSLDHATLMKKNHKENSNKRKTFAVCKKE